MASRFCKVVAAFPVALAVSAALGMLAAAPDCYGQRSGGLFGQRSLGSSFQAGNRTFGGTGAGGGLQQGGIGQGGIGGQGGGQQAGATAGQITGSERFVRGNRQPGQFVGSDAADTTRPRSMLGAQGSQGLQGGPGDLGLGNTGQAGARGGSNINQTGSGERRQSPVRLQFNVGFSHPAPAAPAVSSSISESFARGIEAGAGPAPQVIIQDGVAFLRGTVATEHDRRLARILASLEPGVRSVQNELVVAPAEAVTPAGE